MGHSVTLISTLAAGFAAAWFFGFLAEKIKMPSLVGYLLAGVLISPQVSGLNVDLDLANQLSEIGIMLLMFGVGLHFSLGDLLRIRYLVVPGTLIQMTLSGLVGFFVGTGFGWPTVNAIVFGMTLSCASTVVVLKALESNGLLESYGGQIAVGWLIVQDMVTVLLLVLLPPLASMMTVGEATSAQPLWIILMNTFARVFGFIALMLIVGRRVLPWILWQVARTGSQELFTLTVLTSAIGIAYGASVLFDVSFALGAFFAGMVMRESKYSHRAAVESLPLRDAFAVIFFVGAGMMFDPKIIMEHPLYLIAGLSVVIIINPLVSFFLTLVMKCPLKASLTLGACLGQIGEFSFILAALGVQLKVMTTEGMNLILAIAIISIGINSLIFPCINTLQAFLLKKSKVARVAAARPDPLSIMPDAMEQKYLQGHVVLVGFGDLGRHIYRHLTGNKIKVVVVDKDIALVEELRALDQAAIQGDAQDPAILLQAHVQNASMMIISTGNDLLARRIVETGRVINPTIETVVRCDSQEISDQLIAENIGQVVETVEVVARAMCAYPMQRYGKVQKHKDTDQEALEKAETGQPLEEEGSSAK